MKFSQDIEDLLHQLASSPLTLGQILEQTSERGFSLIIGLLTLPFLIPTPPGLTTLLGTGSLLLSAQMALGRRAPWLPQKVAQAQFPPRLVQALLGLLRRFSSILERWFRVQPRWPNWADHPGVWRLNGTLLAWLVILLMLPIPATNPIPTVGILLLAVATLEGDGLLMWISYGLSLLITILFGVILIFGVAILNQFWQWLLEAIASLQG